MTLRGRLTTAFLAVVLGPVVLGALFVGVTAAGVSRDRAEERLGHATTIVRTAVGALCGQLQAAADAVAVQPDDRLRRATAEQLLGRGLITAARVTGSDGVEVLRIGDATAGPWLDCGGQPAGPGPFTASTPPSGGAGPAADRHEPTVDRGREGPVFAGGADERGTVPPGAVAAHADIRDEAGSLLGAVQVAQRLDPTVINRLAGSAGAAVTVFGDPAGTGVVHSTESAAARPDVVAAATRLTEGAAGRSAAGRILRRVDAGPGQPLTIVVSVPSGEPHGLYGLLVIAVVGAAALAVVAAGWLARSTTRPLADVARAADRVAAGDLDARVPVLREDEVGKLAATFNRMTRELRAYVHALTASRDQLRGHLHILGDTLSSTHDLHRILRVILRTAMAATGARAAVVLLRDPVTDDLVGRCAEGRWGGPDDDITAVRVPVGDGVLGAVAASGEPRRGRLGRDAVPRPGPGPAGYIAVPICAPVPVPDPAEPARPAADPAVLGVLALYDRLGGDEFDDADLGTLRTFAGKAGVAVNNVRVHEEAQRLSLTDPLTGLWNYRYLTESVRREVERASRFGRMLTVLLLDLDRFKEVNDAYGHAAGDAVLTEFARRIRIGLREVDLAFRQGGEEFVVLLPETDAYGGVTVAERLGAAIREAPVPLGSPRPHPATGVTVDRIPISVSIGIAVYPDHGGTAAELLQAADDALYAAKAAGRDTYRLAVSGHRFGGQEITVTAAPAPAEGTAVAAAAPGGAPGPQPPRQGRGR